MKFSDNLSFKVRIDSLKKNIGFGRFKSILNEKINVE